MINDKIKFENYKTKIIESLQSKDIKKLGISEKIELVDGFFKQSVSMELIYDDEDPKFIFGGPNIPTIALVGLETGRIYFFALKALLPDIEI